jgi:serine/threonine protein kinase
VDYLPGERIGGDVYHAAGPAGRAVLKRLPAGAEQLFRAARAIEHPHLVRILDAGTDERGPWIAMPYVDAMTLADPFPNRLSVRAALVLIHPVLEGLAALHAAGLVHGDVRADNVLLTSTGDLTIVDPSFGLVRSKRLCHPPERHEGRELDPSADVWGVGVLLFQLLTGRLPFDDPKEIIEGSFAAPDDLPDDIAWILSICLAPDPWARPLDANALLTRITPLVPCAIGALRDERMALLSDPAGYDRRPSQAPKVRETTPPPPPAPAPRRKVWPIVIAAVCILAAIPLALVWIDDDPPATVVDRPAPPIPIVPLRLAAIPNNLPPDTATLRSYAPGERAPGVIAMRTGRYELAEEMFGTSIASDPEDVSARLHRGVLRHRLGRARDAYGDLTTVLEDDPQNAAALAELAHLYARSGHAEEAAPLLRRLLARDPTDSEVWTDLSMALGPTEEGISAIERAIERAPRSPRAHRQRCLILAAVGDGSAEGACAHAIELNVDDPSLFIADRAIELAPDDGEMFYQRALLRSDTDDGGAFRDLAAGCRLGSRAACREMLRRGVTPPAHP